MEPPDRLPEYLEAAQSLSRDALEAVLSAAKDRDLDPVVLHSMVHAQMMGTSHAFMQLQQRSK